jgi:hypothetical protein
MTPISVLTEARRLGISLAAEGERLTFRAPSGALSSALRSELVANKGALLDLLRFDVEGRANVVLMSGAEQADASGWQAELDADPGELDAPDRQDQPAPAARQPRSPRPPGPPAEGPFWALAARARPVEVASVDAIPRGSTHWTKAGYGAWYPLQRTVDA